MKDGDVALDCRVSIEVGIMYVGVVEGVLRCEQMQQSRHGEWKW